MADVRVFRHHFRLCGCLQILLLQLTVDEGSLTAQSLILAPQHQRKSCDGTYHHQGRHEAPEPYFLTHRQYGKPIGEGAPFAYEFQLAQIVGNGEGTDGIAQLKHFILVKALLLLVVSGLINHGINLIDAQAQVRLSALRGQFQSLRQYT